MSISGSDGTRGLGGSDNPSAGSVALEDELTEERESLPEIRVWLLELVLDETRP